MEWGAFSRTFLSVKLVFKSEPISVRKTTGELLSAISSVQVSPAATRYASALLDLAAEQGVIPQTETELTAFGSALAEVPEIGAILFSPTVKTEDKVATIATVSEKIGLSTLVSNFLGVVATNSRAAELPGMVKAFRDLSAERRGVTRASVKSAHALTDAQVEELKSLVASVAGGEVSMDVDVDPALIAGFQLKIGSRLIDASVKSKLDRMNLAMKGA